VKAGIYHSLGRVAQGQRKWPQAEEYYQKALEIFIEFNDRHNQAGTYHNLGRVAQGQRKWPQAEEYYQKALEIYIEFKDRYNQAKPYGQLGIMALEQRLWDIARENLLKVLEIFFEFGDQHNSEIALRGLSRLWQATTDRRVLDEVTRILSIDQEEAKKLLEGEG
jgi:tetratricopeptide (TPR) repeat protein